MFKKLKIKNIALAITLGLAAQGASASLLCGEVIITETCDVDYCGVHFVTNDYKANETSALAIADNGMIIGHEYEVIMTGLDKLVGKKLCTEGSALEPSYPIVELKSLIQSR